MCEGCRRQEAQASLSAATAERERLHRVEAEARREARLALEEAEASRRRAAAAEDEEAAAASQRRRTTLSLIDLDMRLSVPTLPSAPLPVPGRALRYFVPDPTDAPPSYDGFSSAF